jgi:hypothetical protein
MTGWPSQIGEEKSPAISGRTGFEDAQVRETSEGEYPRGQGWALKAQEGRADKTSVERHFEIQNS